MKAKHPAKPLGLLIILASLLLAVGGFFLIQSATPTVPTYQADEFDYSAVENTREKKQLFFDILRPIVIHENNVIRSQRDKILAAKQANQSAPWIQALAEEHKLEWDNENPDWDRLLHHIDIIPRELVMIQAANESAWGQSRFAQQGNNLFGQWCFTEGCGLVPSQRSSDAAHEVRTFDSINDSVASYLHNLNTSHAYEDLRNIRAELRENNQPFDALTLAEGLSQYSTRGEEYVEEIQSMIRSNLALMQGEQELQ
ncbi:MAG TPA: glucosaminidase domain-containing protein [Gammaproteobacteria bacterium]